MDEECRIGGGHPRRDAAAQPADHRGRLVTVTVAWQCDGADWISAARAYFYLVQSAEQRRLQLISFFVQV
jgi:hypothetical protein